MAEHKGRRKNYNTCLLSQYEKVEMLNNQKGKKRELSWQEKERAKERSSTMTT